MKTLFVAAVAAAALLSPGFASAATDASGSWKLDTSGDMPLTVMCKLAQAGAALSGTCGLVGAPDPPAAFSGGTVDGTTAKWAYDITFQDMPLHVAYTADVQGAAMTGTMDVAGMSIPFKGAKQ